MEDIYESLSHIEKGRELAKIHEEWADYCRQKEQLEIWGQTIQDHYSTLYRSMGAIAMPLQEIHSNQIS